MAYTYFDIKKSVFYTDYTSPLYPFDFTAVGNTVRTHLENFITSVESFHISAIGNVIMFDLTEENKNTIKISAAPFEVDQDDVDSSVFRIKYGYVALFPQNILNSGSVFRSIVHNLCNLDKLRAEFSSVSTAHIVGVKAYAQPVLDITHRNQYNTYAAVVGFKVQLIN